ncbi:bacteriohemerythrin [Thermoanaerobacterium thermosaccharolyticum]|jgi:hemerythrin|uniref:Bacteriohemerythrin n=2 Tax=Thermoanaerobacterium thermosaccharolyticum TaxID=1517 RepID=D9TSS7_THETC|nr:hemerythrin family protein [Thermoanaerobacterium thermosaccharolyticum]ADL68092.1 hemerythrin-like protein metal-binding protein [Thermoanaerobacterium thermosaccharolyticum DSM 571]AST58089.1 bacteriohemerythrin [Thermoanaerobacterium thermosaccharolyticum]KAA5805839.1 bacteriohemerythrin [Thermoanaerobacterium thermosaccharolyticum]MBE0068577.1 bacteriohemerythrin [Thermoanaerobacterium thermosaccharolyticum]MBE0228592.1 bacteriohemerythrin [Thermoanaerobacterium thermosaccharolyticum]
MITWREEFRLGVEEIDKQHKRIFDIANEAYDLLKDEFHLDKYDRIVDIIKDLKNYAVYHFDYEENYMKSIGYRKLLSHKVLHDDFKEKINNIDLDKVDENQDEYIKEILNFVVDWIESHILKTDRLYAEKDLKT